MPDNACRRAAHARWAPRVLVPSMRASVFSQERPLEAPALAVPSGLHLNARMKMDGLAFLRKLPAGSVPVAFFDPQYRGVLDKLRYGNEGAKRCRARCALTQMSEAIIGEFIRGIDAALMPGGHAFLWMDKFHLCSGFSDWLAGTRLAVVDLLTWDKGRMGMGYRTRRQCEYLVVLQKEPRRAKGVWTAHAIPDVVLEKAERGGHPHAKPVELQGQLLCAVSNPGDVVIDPAAGGFSVLEACERHERNFLGCDLNG